MKLEKCPFCGCKPVLTASKAPCVSHVSYLYRWGWRVLIQCESGRCSIKPSTGHITVYLVAPGHTAAHDDPIGWGKVKAAAEKKAASSWNKRKT